MALSIKKLSLAMGRRKPRPGRMPRPMNLKKHEARYEASLRPFFDAFEEAVERAVYDKIDIIVSESQPRIDSDGATLISEIFKGLRINIGHIFNTNNLEESSITAATSLAEDNANQLRKQFQTVLPIDPIGAEPWLADEVAHFTQNNVSLITSVANESLDDIEQMLYRDSRRNLSVTEIKSKIKDQFSLSRSRADLIARDQVLKFNGALTETRQKNSGISEYIWDTSEDIAVRPDHAKLHQTKQKWSNPPITVTSGKRSGERNHPGMDIQCRCQAIPVIDI